MNIALSVGCRSESVVPISRHKGPLLAEAANGTPRTGRSAKRPKGGHSRRNMPVPQSGRSTDIQTTATLCLAYPMQVRIRRNPKADKIDRLCFHVG